MDKFQYLAILAACLACTIPLEFVYGFRVWRAPRRLFRALLPGFCFFVLWDLIGIHRNHWWYAPEYTTGWSFPGDIPVEELLFFIVVPAAAVSGFEAVRAGLARMKADGGRRA